MNQKLKDYIMENLWRDFANTPIDDDESCIFIDEDFMHFKSGADIEDVWRWFDENHSKGLGFLYENIGYKNTCFYCQKELEYNEGCEVIEDCCRVDCCNKCFHAEHKYADLVLKIAEEV